MLTPTQLTTYLARIGIPSPPQPTLAGLHTLQAAHMRAVPFENLDILMGRPLSLDPADLFIKIVTRRRGGYCFELNTLYAQLLAALGFAPTPVMARVWLRNPAETPPRTHLAHLVTIDSITHITDVGFGGSASHVPLPLNDALTPDPDGHLRIRPDPAFGQRVQRRLTGETVWTDQFTFETAPAPASDILVGNHYTETHPDSHFRHGMGVGQFATTGRTGLYGGTLTYRAASGTTHTAVSGLEPTLDVLKDVFGLDLQPTPKERDRLSQFC